MNASFSWSFTTGPAPAVTFNTPASGATGVATGSDVTPTFNEAVQSGTITFTLTTMAAGTSVAAAVSYNAPPTPQRLHRRRRLETTRLHRDREWGQRHGWRSHERAIRLVVHDGLAFIAARLGRRMAIQ